MKHSLRGILELVREDLDYQYSGAVPRGLTVCRPFRTMATGDVVSPWSGMVDLKDPITVEHLNEMVRVFKKETHRTPVVIDWNHGSHTDSTSPKNGKSMGRVVDAFIRDLGDGRGPGMYVTPAYTKAGAALVDDQEGVLWSSPEFYIGEVFDRREAGKRIGSAQLFAVALTGRPAQTTDMIDSVTLRNQGSTMTPEDLAKLIKLSETVTAENNTLRAAAALKDKEIEELKTAGAVAGAGAGGVDDDAVKKISALFDSRAAAMTEENNTLRTSMAALQKSLEAMEEKGANAAGEATVDALIANGAVAPVNRDAALEAYKLKDTAPAMWALVSKPTAPAVPLGTVGHGGTGPAPTPGAQDPEAAVKAMDSKVRTWCTKNPGKTFKYNYREAVRAIEAEEAAAAQK